MEALRIIQKPQDGHLRLDIAVPITHNTDDFEVIIRPLPVKSIKHDQQMAIIQQFKGAMQNDQITEDFDVYDQ